jgi:rhodanese-related sulfurtransferase
MKALFIIIITLFTDSFLLRSQVQDSSRYQSLEPSSFQKKNQEEPNSILIDVREYSEFRKSRIKGSINIPFSGGFDAAGDSIDKERAFFIYCYSGGRSKKAALSFYDKGFRKLYSLKGGIIRWKNEGMPLVRKRLTSRAAASKS